MPSPVSPPFCRPRRIFAGGGRSANSQYQYTLLGDDLTELRDWSQKLRIALQDVPEVTDVDTDLQPGGLEADLIVDRDAASRLGLTASQIDNALGDAFAQAQVSTIYNPFSPQQYHVVMEVAPEFWQNPDVLKQLYVSTSGGAVTGTQATQAVAGTTSVKTASSSQTSASHDCGGGCPGYRAQSGSQLTGQCRPRQHFDRFRGQCQPRDHGSLLGVQSLCHRDDAHHRKPHGDPGLDFDLLQPARRRIARAWRWPPSNGP